MYATFFFFCNTNNSLYLVSAVKHSNNNKKKNKKKTKKMKHSSATSYSRFRHLFIDELSHLQFSTTNINTDENSLLTSELKHFFVEYVKK